MHSIINNLSEFQLNFISKYADVVNTESCRNKVVNLNENKIHILIKSIGLCCADIKLTDGALTVLSYLPTLISLTFPHLIP